jgi:hypothetical protein
MVPICGGGGGLKKWLRGGAGGGGWWWIWLCGGDGGGVGGGFGYAVVIEVELHALADGGYACCIASMQASLAPY